MFAAVKFAVAQAIIIALQIGAVAIDTRIALTLIDIHFAQVSLETCKIR